MKRPPDFMERWGINCLGFGFLVLGIVVAPIPGPGGTPLILLGLGLLSIHNHWAYRLRKYILNSHQSISAVIFPSNPWVRFIWDLGGAVAFGLGLSILLNLESIWPRIIATILLTVALSIWGSNHRRAERFVKHLNSRRKNHKAKNKPPSRQP